MYLVKISFFDMIVYCIKFTSPILGLIGGENMFFNKFLISVFISFSFIFSQQISFTNAEINAGDNTNISVLLNNPQAISGFQFQIMDLPDQGFFTDVQPTERTSAFMVSFNEQPDGSLIIVGFSLTG